MQLVDDGLWDTPLYLTYLFLPNPYQLINTGTLSVYVGLHV